MLRKHSALYLPVAENLQYIPRYRLISYALATLVASIDGLGLCVEYCPRAEDGLLILFKVLANLLALAVVCPFVGSLSDLMGRRYVAIIGACLIIIGVTVASTAHNMNVFIGGYPRLCASERTIAKDHPQAGWQ